MNMIGHPKHVSKALKAGCDIICAQGGEGGGHTGDIATSILIPKVVDMCRGRTQPINGKPVLVVAAGGIFDGRGLAAALVMGASGVWVGTRFVNSVEAGASKAHQDAVRTAGFDDTIRTIIFTGRPLRVRKNKYIMDWEENRKDEIKRLTSKGTIPIEHDMERLENEGRDDADDLMVAARPFLMGQVAAMVNDVKPAKQIIDDMVKEAIEALSKANKTVVRSRL